MGESWCTWEANSVLGQQSAPTWASAALTWVCRAQAPCYQAIHVGNGSLHIQPKSESICFSPYPLFKMLILEVAKSPSYFQRMNLGAISLCIWDIIDCILPSKTRIALPHQQSSYATTAMCFPTVFYPACSNPACFGDVLCFSCL